MVKRLIISTIWPAVLAVLMALCVPAQAGELTAEPDRTQLYEGEVLTLTVKGTTKIDINLSNLFDFDISSLPSPDIEKVSPNFDILARNQRYSIRTVNGDMVGEITWIYQLAPTSTGELTIPALTFKDSVSSPVTIEVVDGNPPDQANANRNSFIELTTDKAEVYVQEQLILTVRLFFRGNLIRGELSDPEHPNAIIETLGKQNESSRLRDGVRYRVVERRYAVFPQKSGTLNLPAIRFEGQARDADGSLKFLRDSAQLFEVQVNDVPAAFSGSTWLPATSLTLAEAGMPPTLNLKTGDNLTRTLSLQAIGLPSEALPPLPDAVPDGLRSYPENPQRDTNVGPDGITSTLTQTRALVPVEAGSLTLPAIRIPWWDTVSNSEKVAIIPAQTLNITGVRSDKNSEASNENNAAVPIAGSNDSQSTPPGTGSQESAANAEGTTANSNFWQWVSLTLAGIWALTMLVWWRTRKMASEPSASGNSSDVRDERSAFEQLLNAAKQGRVSTPGRFVSWANLRLPGQDFSAAGDVFRVFPEPHLERELNKLQAHLFSRGHAGSDRWDGRVLILALKQAREGMANASSEAGLPPLYPDNLSVSG
ncbi:Oxygen tolerance [Marinobacter sp. LV10R510-11A]|uniref:BatD family protein n=1 Tax=Marinobacter sp. LV10R510-11A TaxID=1415568 RepID=UPI000BB9B762|nr:BatD family protein [Marinobacter sp. LV10R510-11A]SOB74855.1 Oxygen tolerance [Marinobacter sp. LV10R510-11A]